MTDTPSIPPALTASEWAEARASQRSVLDFALMNDEGYIRPVTPERLHAVAALSLYGQPFGFTQEDVRLLRESVERLESLHDDWCVFYCQCVGARNALAKIEALLPPKQSLPAPD